MTAPGRTTERYRGARPSAWPAEAGRWLPGLALVILLVASVWLGLAQFIAPASLPASAPPAAFSAERAMGDLAAIAQAPRPMGSPGHAAAEQYLVDRLTAMGLQPQVQATTGVATMENGSVWAGSVRNIVARIPGTASTGGILLASHYDSVPTGPGAGDCGSCVASVLETVRALRAGPSLQNDVIVLFADAEEHDMLGAKTFMAQHPWAADVEVALNFEALSPSGATLVNYVKAGHGPLVDAFLRAAPHPLASSLLTSVGIGNDAVQYASRGAAGFEMAHLDQHLHAYHTAVDNLQRTDPRSLQHNGSYLLAAARQFGDMDLSAPRSGDRVFFNVAPDRVVWYPTTWVTPLAVATLLLLAGVLALGFRRRRLTLGGMALGAAALLGGVVVSAGLVTLAEWALKRLVPNYHVFMDGTAYHPELLLLAFVALALAVMTAAQLWLPRRAAASLAAGAMLTWGLLLIGSALLVPGASYLFTWPLLGAILALGWLCLLPAPSRPGPRSWQAVLAPALALVPAVVLVIPVVVGVAAVVAYAENSVQLPLAAVPVVFVALGLGLVLPLLSLPGHAHRRVIPAASGLVALLLVGAAVALSGFSASQPRPDQIAYVLDADTNQASWVSVGDRTDHYTAQFFPNGAERTEFVPLPSEGPERTFPALRGPAPVAPLPPPQVALVNEAASSGGGRVLALRVTSPRHAQNAEINLEAPAGITQASVNGQPAALPEGGGPRPHLKLQYYGLPHGGIDLTLVTGGPGPVTVAVEDRSNGLPAVPGLTLQPRPADTMPAPFEMADPTLVRTASTF